MLLSNSFNMTATFDSTCPATGRFDDTLHMYPVVSSILSGLRMTDIVPTVLMDPSQPPATVLVAVEKQRRYERDEQDKQDVLLQKYDYFLWNMSSFDYQITYTDAVILFQEVVSQLHNHYFDKRMQMNNEIYEKLIRLSNHSEEERDQILLQMEKKVESFKNMCCVVMSNTGYMIHSFTQKWLQRYPDTDKTKLVMDLKLSYKGMDRMMGRSPKGWHPLRMQEMDSFVIDSKEEWFISEEEYQNDMKNFTELFVQV
jgi:hypothetical protein